MPRSTVAGFVCALALGVAFCLWCLGPTILEGRSIDWLMAGDRAQSFLGWQFYRGTPESFPLGRIPALLYPVGASLAYTDAFPWFAVALKPLSPWLPVVYQISGWWLVLSYALLAGFAFLILQRLAGDATVALAGSVLVVASPALTRRGGHISLCAHWLIVAAFFLALAPRRGIARFVAPWSVLLVLASGTHPYLATMVLAIGLAACAVGDASPIAHEQPHSAIRDPRCPWPLLVAARAALLLLVTAAALYVFGYVGAPSTTAAGFGTYSANLLTLLDPDGASRILPSFATAPGQYEGFGFVGAGVLLVLVAATVASTVRSTARHGLPARAALDPTALRALPAVALVVLAMTVFSFGSTWLLGSHRVASAQRFYAWLEPLPSTFRASGRFVWPLHYAVVLGAVVWLARTLRARALVLTILVAAIALQLWDQGPLYASADARMQGRSHHWRPLPSPLWRLAAEDYDEIRLVPPYLHEAECPGSAYPPFFYMRFAYAAALGGMRIDSGHLSRQPVEQLAALCRDVDDANAIGRVDDRVLYVVSDDALACSTAVDLGLARCGRVDGYNVCVSTRRTTRFATALPVTLERKLACTGFGSPRRRTLHASPPSG